MARRELKVGDHVSWNSEAGRVRGVIRKKVTAPAALEDLRAVTRRASSPSPF